MTGELNQSSSLILHLNRVGEGIPLACILWRSRAALLLRGDLRGPQPLPRLPARAQAQGQRLHGRRLRRPLLRPRRVQVHWYQAQPRRALRQDPMRPAEPRRLRRSTFRAQTHSIDPKNPLGHTWIYESNLEKILILDFTNVRRTISL